MTESKRYPPVIMATCVVPWTSDWEFHEQAFRTQVQDLAKEITRHLYVFGTAGEGYSVTEAQFDRISRVFLEECIDLRAEPTIGILHLSLPVIIQRIEKARNWGFRSFQISLPSWGALNDAELNIFFQETCARFADCRFIHYNLSRAKRVVTAKEYARLATVHPNLVATKNTKDDESFLHELLTCAPTLQHFLGEMGFARMRDRFECGLLISLATTHPQRAHEFFEARGSKLRVMGDELRAVRASLIEVVGPSAHMDGAYDKLLYKVRRPEFPLRLQIPYQSADEVNSLERYFTELRRLAPSWLPSARK